MRLHSTWRCPACGTTRTTTPCTEALCVSDDCPEEFSPMQPHEDPPPPDPRLSFPELTGHQRMVDQMMRSNRGLIEQC